MARFPGLFAEVASQIGIDRSAIEREVAAMQDHVLAKTASRSVLGVMNDFARLALEYRGMHETIDLMDLSLWLAHVPCSPLEGRDVFPDRALKSLLG